MAGYGNPPEGTPGGHPGSGDDEYPPVVFDESFVRAARLQELSAQERMGDHARPVRPRRPWARSGGSRQAVALVLLIAFAFAAAVYMGVRHPYQDVRAQAVDRLRAGLVPLAPTGVVPGGRPAALFRHSPARDYRQGAAGFTMPGIRRTADFSESQVTNAVAIVRDYLVESTLNPAVIVGGSVQRIRLLLDPRQIDEFDQSVRTARPAAADRAPATGWLNRFDTAQVALAGAPIRVHGTLDVVEHGAAYLEIVADHTFVYAVRGARDRDADHASLYTVRRETRFRLDRADLRDHHVQLVQTTAQAGPQACAVDTAAYLRPLLAGQSAAGDRPAATDPYAVQAPPPALCGRLGS